MASVSAVPIKGTTIRIVQTDLCGVPVTGASGSVVITNSFTKIAQSPQYQDGVEFFELTADGQLCLNQKDQPIFKRMQLTVDLCAIDPDMMPLVLSARELTTTGPVSGYGFAISEGASTTHYSMEVWQRVGGLGACDPTTGLQRYIYNAWPHCTNTRSTAYSVENAKSVLSFMCETAAASSLWGDGPGTGTSWLPVGAAGIAAAGDHWLWNITTNAPPASSVGKQVLT